MQDSGTRPSVTQPIDSENVVSGFITGTKSDGSSFELELIAEASTHWADSGCSTVNYSSFSTSHLCQ